MGYSHGEEMAMSKIMSDSEVMNFIIKRKDEEGMNFEQIAKELAKAGHKSPRTGKPLAAQSCRYIYFYGPKKRGLKDETTSEGATRNLPVSSNWVQDRLNLIKGIVDINTNDKSKIEMIKAVLKDA